MSILAGRRPSGRSQVRRSPHYLSQRWNGTVEIAGTGQLNRSGDDDEGNRSEQSASSTGSRRDRRVGVGAGRAVLGRCEAVSRHCPLHIVHAFSWPVIGNALEMGFTVDTNLGLRSAAEWVLAEAAAQARELAPDIKVTTALIAGPATPTLLSEAQDADLVVVGGRGVGGFRGLLGGSGGGSIAAQAPSISWWPPPRKKQDSPCSTTTATSRPSPVRQGSRSARSTSDSRARPLARTGAKPIAKPLAR